MSEIIKYNSLVSQIAALIQDSRQQVVRAVNSTVTITYWEIGRYIVEYEQDGKERAAYGKELLQNLSDDLTKQFGKGFSYRNLRLFRQFYSTFLNWQTVYAKSDDDFWHTLSAKSKNNTIEYISGLLSWSHFVRLLSIKSETERTYYLKESILNNWSVRDLDRQINSALFERQMLSKK